MKTPVCGLSSSGQFPGCPASVCPPPFTSLLLFVVYQRESDPVQFYLFTSCRMLLEDMKEAGQLKYQTVVLILLFSMLKLNMI